MRWDGMSCVRRSYATSGTRQWMGGYTQQPVRPRQATARSALDGWDGMGWDEM